VHAQGFNAVLLDDLHYDPVFGSAQWYSFRDAMHNSRILPDVLASDFVFMVTRVDYINFYKITHQNLVLDILPFFCII
jgi:hypothetical protein